MWGGGVITTTTTAANSYWASNYNSLAIVLSMTHVLFHLIITKTLWGQYFCYPYFIAEGTKVLGLVTGPRSLWLVGWPRSEFGQSRSRVFFHCYAWYLSERSVKVTLEGPKRLCQEETRTSWWSKCLSHALETLMASDLLENLHSAFWLKKLITSGLWSLNKGYSY